MTSSRYHVCSSQKSDTSTVTHLPEVDLCVKAIWFIKKKQNKSKYTKRKWKKKTLRNNLCVIMVLVNPLPVSNYTQPIRTKLKSSQYHQTIGVRVIPKQTKVKRKSSQRKVTNARSRNRSHIFIPHFSFYIIYFFFSTDTGRVSWRGRRGGVWCRTWFWRLSGIGSELTLKPQTGLSCRTLKVPRVW